ncbi:MAG: hypothetical protein Kow0049_15290 [Stanieria sp.]
MKTFSIEKSLLIKVPPRVIFEALTNSEKIVQYYPLKEVVSDWQVGSEIIGKGSNNNQDFIDYRTIDVLIPNQKFQYTYWSDNHGTERIPENYLTICYTLFPSNKGTILKLEHHNIKSQKMYSDMLNIWDFLLSNLKEFVEKNYSK